MHSLQGLRKSLYENLPVWLCAECTPLPSNFGRTSERSKQFLGHSMHATRRDLSGLIGSKIGQDKSEQERLVLSCVCVCANAVAGGRLPSRLWARLILLEDV